MVWSVPSIGEVNVGVLYGGNHEMGGIENGREWSEKKRERKGTSKGKGGRIFVVKKQG